MYNKGEDSANTEQLFGTEYEGMSQVRLLDKTNKTNRTVSF